MEPRQNRNWSDYYSAIAGRPPRPLFTNALARFRADPAPPSAPFAIDLGCGDGTETFALLEHGWTVLAIDQEPAAIAILQSNLPPAWQARLEMRTAAFEQVALPPADFIFAGFSLPFCAPAHFDHLWAAIIDSLRPGGRFAGQLFGERDSWATDPRMTFHTAEQVQQLLAPFIVEILHEEEEDGRAVSGPKHWHLYHIIAQKARAEAQKSRG